MKFTPIFIAACILSGCLGGLDTRRSPGRSLTPADLVIYATTRPEGGFVRHSGAPLLGEKIDLLSVRKSKDEHGYGRVYFDMRNGSHLRQVINVSFEWLAADGTVTESRADRVAASLEPGVLTTLTATARNSSSVECRLRVVRR
jgi:hypothetical protein